jgi:hypothetical protein
MRKSYLCLGLIVCSFGLSACNSSRVIGPAEYSARSDYAVDNVYTLQRPAFVFKYRKTDPKETPFLAPLGFSGTPLNLADFQRYALNGNQVLGLLLPGDSLRIVKFIENKFINLGEFLEVIAVVESGEQAGVIVELSMISRSRRPSYNIFVDPEYLSPR